MTTVLRAVAAVVIVAAIGFVLARAGRGTSHPHASPPAMSGHAASGSFRVEYPADWRRLSGPPSHLVPPLGEPLALAPNTTGEELIIGTAPAGSSRGQLPKVMRSAIDTHPRADIVELGDQRFSRYLNLKPRGQGVTETIYLLPATSGTLGAVCAAQTPSTSFIGDCERVLGTLKLSSGSALTPGIDPSYALRLNAILATLNAARSSAGSGLQTGALSSRAQVAQTLAAAHAAAAAALDKLTPIGPGLAVANRRLAGVLAQTAVDYRALGDALTGRRDAAYRAARSQLDANGRALSTAYARLSRFGYRPG
jgi:hypothetical protein